VAKFLRVRCECGNVQIIYECATTEVWCFACNKKLCDPTGGKAVIHGEILEVLE